MWKRRLGIIFSGALILSALGATSASARSDETLTIVCTGGQVIVADANSLTGQLVATGVYNDVNPFGEVCTINP